MLVTHKLRKIYISHSLRTVPVAQPVKTWHQSKPGLAEVSRGTWRSPSPVSHLGPGDSHLRLEPCSPPSDCSAHQGLP